MKCQGEEIVTQINRWFVRAAGVLAVAVLCSCSYTYTPDQTSVQKMSLLEARKVVLSAIEPPAGLEENRVFSSMSIGTSTITVVKVRQNKKYDIPLKDLEPSAFAPPSLAYGVVYLNDDQSFYVDPANQQELKRVADALFVLKSAALSEQDYEPRFQEAARDYRASAVKPQLPEAARRFQVQAEDAIDRKDFDAAADYYQQALDVAPWWPEGHYDRAVVLSETDDFPDAIIEMKRYLVLVPNAPNARALQDRIYKWEGRTSAAD
jgi:hypothetical protein